MSDKINDGGSAFPQCYRVPGYSDVVGASGMMLRDYIAAKALVGWLSGPCAGNVLDDYKDFSDAFVQHQQAVAKTCYGYADAMLAAREVRG